MVKLNRRFFVLYAIIFFILIVVSLFQYQLFHISVEMITIFFGLFVFILSINSRMYTKNILLLMIGLIYIYVGLLDFLHTVSYDGLDIIFNNTNKSNQFWILARLLESAGFFVTFTFLKNKTKINYNVIHSILVVYTLLAIILISTDVLPAFFIVGQGQTPIKLAVEFIVILLYFLTILSVSKTQNVAVTYRTTLYIILIIKILSELAFTQYTSTIDTYTIIGHLLKYLSFAGIYYIFVSEILLNPKQNIYSLFQQKEKDLLNLSQIDQLTKLYNHQTTFDKADSLLHSTEVDKSKLFIAMIDIDDFKILNDTFGHQFGDNVLSRFSRILEGLDCAKKIVGRYGGDEFLVCGIASDSDFQDTCFKNARDNMKKEFTDINFPVTFSVGLVFYKDGDTLRDLIYKADINLYKSKRNGKDRITY